MSIRPALGNITNTAHLRADPPRAQPLLHAIQDTAPVPTNKKRRWEDDHEAVHDDWKFRIPNGSDVTRNEYFLAINVLRSIRNSLADIPSESKTWFNKHFGTRLTEQVHKLTGLSRKICDRAKMFEQQDTFIESNKRGPRKSGSSPDIVKLVVDIADKSNMEGRDNSAPKIVNELREDHGINVSATTVRDILVNNGFYYGVGVRHHILHDSPANVTYRHQYVKDRLDNLVLEGEQRYRPKHSEVFLDESYCHVHHVSRKRWVRKNGGRVADPGRKPLLVIFAAFVVYWDKDMNDGAGGLEAKFVKDYVFIWPASGGNKREKNKELWLNVPPEIKEHNIIADEHDYHGNFNSAVFGKLFERLIKSLNEMGLPESRIHLDGASYHFHNENRIPTPSSTKAEIREFMEDPKHPINIPEGKNSKKGPTKQELLDKINEAGIQPKYTIYEHAKNGNHVIMKTPPYHCELQPIEKIWGVVKNKVASNATGKETNIELKKNLERLFVQIPPLVFISVWLKSIHQAEEYLKEAEANPPPLDPLTPAATTNDLPDQEQQQPTVTVVRYFIPLTLSNDNNHWRQCLIRVDGVDPGFISQALEDDFYDDESFEEAELDEQREADFQAMARLWYETDGPEEQIPE